MATISGIVLLGGRSRRMGRDKSTLPLDGETLLQHTVRALSAVADEIVLVGARGRGTPAVATERPLIVVEDAIEDSGPLVGLATGLAATRGPVAVVVGVDMPFLQPALLRLLAQRVADGARWALPIADGRPQPLCSAIARDVLPLLRERIEAGDRALMAAVSAVGGQTITPDDWGATDPDGLSFFDLDTPEDLARAERHLAQIRMNER